MLTGYLGLFVWTIWNIPHTIFSWKPAPVTEHEHVGFYWYWIREWTELAVYLWTFLSLLSLERTMSYISRVSLSTNEYIIVYTNNNLILQKKTLWSKMFTTLVPLIFCLLHIYPRAWSFGHHAATKCNVSQNPIDKNILVDNWPIPDIPFQDIVDRFSVSQRNFKSKKRCQHLFITMPYLNVTVSALKTAYCTKVNGGASKRDSIEVLFVYTMNVRELQIPTVPVAAFNLRIS